MVITGSYWEKKEKAKAKIINELRKKLLKLYQNSPVSVVKQDSSKIKSISRTCISKILKEYELTECIVKWSMFCEIVVNNNVPTLYDFIIVIEGQ